MTRSQYLPDLIMSGIAGAWADVRAYSSFAAAITAIGDNEKTLVIPDAQTVTTDVPVPANVTLHFLRGGSLSVASTKTVTIYSPENLIVDKMQHIFTGDGTVNFTLLGTGYVEWWGADPTGATDSSDAFQSAFDTLLKVELCADAEYSVAEVSLPQLCHFHLNGNGAKLAPYDTPSYVLYLEDIAETGSIARNSLNNIIIENLRFGKVGSESWEDASVEWSDTIATSLISISGGNFVGLTIRDIRLYGGGGTHVIKWVNDTAIQPDGCIFENFFAIGTPGKYWKFLVHLSGSGGGFGGFFFTNFYHHYYCDTSTTPASYNDSATIYCQGPSQFNRAKFDNIYCNHCAIRTYISVACQFRHVYGEMSVAGASLIKCDETEPGGGSAGRLEACVFDVLKLSYANRSQSTLSPQKPGISSTPTSKVLYGKCTKCHFNSISISAGTLLEPGNANDLAYLAESSGIKTIELLSDSHSNYFMNCFDAYKANPLAYYTITGNVSSAAIRNVYRNLNDRFAYVETTPIEITASTPSVVNIYNVPMGSIYPRYIIRWQIHGRVTGTNGSKLFQLQSISVPGTEIGRAALLSSYEGIFILEGQITLSGEIAVSPEVNSRWMYKNTISTGFDAIDTDVFPFNPASNFQIRYVTSQTAGDVIYIDSILIETIPVTDSSTFTLY